MLWVGLLLALLLLAGFATAFFAARERIVADAEARTRYEARQAADRLDATMRSVQVSGEALIELSNRVELTRTELLAAMEAMLEANPSTVGGLVALEPGVLADRAPLAHYVGIGARGVPDRDLLADGYDLAGRDWYQRTLHATSAWWSEPYFNETAGGRYMTTLNLPLRDREARRIGMVSLDVPVQALSVVAGAVAHGERPAHGAVRARRHHRRACGAGHRLRARRWPATWPALDAATWRRWRLRARNAAPCSSTMPMRAMVPRAIRCCSRSATAAGACSFRSAAMPCSPAWTARCGCWP